MSMLAAKDPRPPLACSPRDVETASEVLRRAFLGVDANVDFALADGTVLWQPAAASAAKVTLRNLGILRLLFTSASDIVAGEAFARGDVAVTGDLERALRVMEAVAVTRTPRELVAIASLCMRLPRPPSHRTSSDNRGPAKLQGQVHSPQRDRAAIAYHYDLSNDFFQLWLDENMTYSCAYFRTPADTLETAQLQKCDLICRKLALRPDEHLLDVGCGWGSLVRFAAREYGVRAVGVTLSKRQGEYARRRIEADGLASRCRVELLDYREMQALGSFDKVASVGMVEHVGETMFPTYFGCVFRALSPGGLFLNHGIIRQPKPPAGEGALRKRRAHRSHFTERYIFPDGELPRLPQMTEAAQNAGFEVRHVENLRESYTLTLREWRRRLEAREPAARAAVGDATYNIWRVWLAGSARGFDSGRLGVVQMLLAKA